jgi:uncharacterized membrane protein YjjB (DUF3815 family)
MEKLNEFFKRYLRSWDWLLVVYCLPWGIYKVFFQTHHSVYSIAFGSIMIVGALGIVATNIMELRKKRALNKSS